MRLAGVRMAREMLQVVPQVRENEMLERDTITLFQMVGMSGLRRVYWISFLNKGNLFLNRNTFETYINVAIVLRAMGVETDQETVQLVGTEPSYGDGMAATLHDCAKEAYIRQCRHWYSLETRRIRIKTTTSMVREAQWNLRSDDKRTRKSQQLRATNTYRKPSTTEKQRHELLDGPAGSSNRR